MDEEGTVLIPFLLSSVLHQNSNHYNLHLIDKTVDYEVIGCRATLQSYHCSMSCEELETDGDREA